MFDFATLQRFQLEPLKVTFLNLPPTPTEFRNHKLNLSIADLEDLVKIGSAVLETS